MKVRALDYQTKKRRQKGRKSSSSGKRFMNKHSLAFLEDIQKYSDNYLRQLASLKAQAGDYKQAIEIFNQLIQRHPNSAIDYNNRGLTYFEGGEMKKAIADYNKALELNPQLAAAYNNQANYYAALGQLAEALAAYQQAIDINPSYIRAWINQGITFRQLGMYALALENFDFALLLGQLEGYIYAQRGRTYHLRGDWNCAIADYRRALTLLPQSSLSLADAAMRLRVQVQNWINLLLNPLASI